MLSQKLLLQEVYDNQHARKTIYVVSVVSKSSIDSAFAYVQMLFLNQITLTCYRYPFLLICVLKCAVAYHR